jgi:transglutaminase-like putative cysteine protease
MSFRLVIAALGALALCGYVSELRAQAPVISPAGDPSVSADSIYKLAVNPKDFPEDAVIYLLDDGVVRIDATGRGTRTYRQVIQILKQPAVAAFSERRFGYAPDHEKFTLNWARVLRATGEVVSDKPAQMQETDVAAATANPVYSNAKEVRLSLGGVAVGTIIDMSFTTEETKPYREGDVFTAWSLNSPGMRVLRTRFIVDVPAAVRPVITERNLDFKVQTTERDGRRTYQWAKANVPKFTPEPFSPDTNSVSMHVTVSLPTTWTDIATWYGSLTLDRYTLTPTMETKLRELVSGAKTRLDTIRAVHRWVAQDIRYVSVSLGLGGYQPRQPEQTFTTGFGDCKDKTTLFVAALRKVGISAFPVLTHSNALAVRKEHPSIRQFNHVIAAVRDGKELVFTDLTSGFTPYGELPWPEQGGFAVVVLADGRAQEVTLPKAPFLSRKIESRIVATMSDSGLMSGIMEEFDSGGGFEARRILFSVPLDSAQGSNVMRMLLGILPGAKGDSIRAFNGRDLYAAPHYTIFFSNARGTAQAGGLELFTLPWGVMPGAARVSALNRFGPRKTSIIAESVLRAPPPTSSLVTMTVTLPEGWRARVPANVVVTSDFGTYSTEYSQDGRVLKIVRREISAQGIYPPSRFGDVTAFFKATSADENNKTIVIDKGPR